MPDTQRTLAALQTIFADNTAGDISPQDLRDFLVSVMGRTKSVWLPIGSYTIAQNTPDYALRGSSANTYEKSPGWSFDGSAAEGITGNFKMPADWDGGAVTVKYYWSPSDGNAGDVAWSIYFTNIDGNDQIDEALGSQATATAATPAVADQMTVSTLSSVTPGADMQRVFIQRDGAAGGDTYNAHDAWLHGVEIEYTAAF